MDEAEYCHRIGLMVDGRLVALDEPAELKRKHVPGRIVKVAGQDVARVLAPLRTFAGVHEAHAFGAAAHARFDPERTNVEAIRRALAEKGFDRLTVEPIEPNLEDVFLAVVESESRERRAVDA
jgi:ABC-2 type transport system ATP-binding protein